MQPKLVVVPSDLPEPPYPKGILYRGWTFDLNLDQIEQSSTWIKCPLEIRPWLVAIWYGSWRNAPCGSYPDDEEVIAGKIGMPFNLFKVHRDVLLRGWQRHSDGRLYHCVVTELVLKMISKRTSDRVRQSKHREKTSANSTEQNHTLIPKVTRDSHDVTESHVPPPPPPQKKDLKQGQDQKKKKDAHVLTIADLQHDGLTAALSVEWLEHRQRKKAALTRRAWDAIKAEAAKLHWTPTRAVEKALAKDWRGFEAEWITKGQTQGSEVAPPGRNWGKVPGV